MNDQAARFFDDSDFFRDKDIQAAWSEELRKRIEELETGQAKAIPWAEARRLILED